MNDRRVYGLIAAPNEEGGTFRAVWFFRVVAFPSGQEYHWNEIGAIKYISAEDAGLSQFNEYGDGDCYWVDEPTYQEMCDAVSRLNEV